MKTIAWILALFLLPAFVVSQNVSAAPTADSPDEVTSKLLHTAVKHFGMDADNLKLEKQWLAPDLYARLVKKANQPVAKGDAPDIEGDVFLNSQEDPTSISVGKPVIDQDKAIVEVTLKFDQEKVKYDVLLKQIDGAWKVYDVDYKKDGKLTDLLK